MATNIDPDLERKSRETPDGLFKVVITLSKDAKDIQPSSLDVINARSLEGLEGVCAATVTGQQALKLAGLIEIDFIEEDIEQQIL